MSVTQRSKATAIFWNEDRSSGKIGRAPVRWERTIGKMLSFGKNSLTRYAKSTGAFFFFKVPQS
jgi:hypothetical protein